MVNQLYATHPRVLFPMQQAEAEPISQCRNSVEMVIAIPAYNEERFIGSVVIQAMSFTPHVLVIDDGSSDATAYIARQAGAQVLQHATNAGKSQAVNTALDWARLNGAQCLVFIDGDGQAPGRRDRVRGGPSA